MVQLQFGACLAGLASSICGNQHTAAVTGPVPSPHAVSLLKTPEPQPSQTPTPSEARTGTPLNRVPRTQRTLDEADRVLLGRENENLDFMANWRQCLENLVKNEDTSFTETFAAKWKPSREEEFKIDSGELKRGRQFMERWENDPQARSSNRLLKEMHEKCNALAENDSERFLPVVTDAQSFFDHSDEDDDEREHKKMYKKILDDIISPPELSVRAVENLHITSDECPVCYSNCCDTKLSPCGHEFCSGCAKYVYTHCQQTCPLCRSKFQGADFKSQSDQY